MLVTFTNKHHARSSLQLISRSCKPAHTPKYWQFTSTNVETYMHLPLLQGLACVYRHSWLCSEINKCSWMQNMACSSEVTLCPCLSRSDLVWYWGRTFDKYAVADALTWNILFINGLLPVQRFDLKIEIALRTITRNLTMLKKKLANPDRTDQSGSMDTTTTTTTTPYY